MSYLTQARTKLGHRLDSSRLGSVPVVPLVDALLIAAFLVDLLTPFFVWKGYLPDAVSWISQAFTAAAVAFAYARMMFLKRIPGAVWLIAGVSAIGITVAVFRGQGVVATFWGWWQLFKYPLVGLYVYLRPGWHDEFAQRLTKATLIILICEAIFQIVQYLAGDPPGDSLAGTFGLKGAAQVLFLSVFVLSLTVGQWLTQRQWKPLLWALAAGIVSSVLAENKILPIAVLLLAMLAVFFLLLRGGELARPLLFVALLVAGVLIFTMGYNAFVPAAQRKPLEQSLLDEETRNAYLNRVNRSQDSNRLSQGRNALVGYAFSTIAGDPVTFLWGYGLGARGESASLGVAGAAYQAGRFKKGSNLVVLIQEMGLFGLAVVGGFVLWVSVVLFRDIRRYPDSPAVGLRYGLLLFSVLWPLWLWYKRPLDSRVAMWLYWIALGYVLGEPHVYDLDAPL
jgi:hypothetical protein